MRVPKTMPNLSGGLSKASSDRHTQLWGALTLSKPITETGNTLCFTLPLVTSRNISKYCC